MPAASRDTLPPYASGAARLGLIYRLTLDGGGQRLLVVSSQSAAMAAIGAANPDAEFDVIAPGAGAPRPPYDAVFLPELAPGRAGAASRNVPQQLQAAHAWLVPGGVLAGDASHLHSIRGMADLVRGRMGPLAWLRGAACASPSACRRTLQRYGFADVECYYVEPHIESPLTLVPDHRAAARRHFLRAVRRTRGQYRWPGYLARLLLAGAGLGGQMQRHLFFCARRPC